MGGFTPAVRTAPTVLTGDRSIDLLPAQLVTPDISDEVLFAIPQAAAITLLTKRFRKKVAVQREYGYASVDEYPRNSSVGDAAGISAAATTLNVPTGEGSRFYAGASVINHSTGEVFRVASVATDALTIVRLSNAQIMANGDALEILGATFEDGVNKGAFVSTKPDYDFNYTEITRNAFGSTGRDMNTELLTSKNDPELLKQEKAIEHARDLEMKAIFQRRFKRTGTSGKEETYGGGILYFLRTNGWHLNGIIPTQAQCYSFLEDVMRYGEGGYVNAKEPMKTIIASPRWCSLFDAWGRDKIEYTTDTEVLGLRIGYLNFHGGKLAIIRHPLLVGPVKSGLMLVLDFNHLTWRYHKGRNTMLREGIQDPSADAKENEYLTDCSVQTELEYAHGWADGLPPLG